MKNIKPKALTTFLGIAFVLITLEILLRGLGALYKWHYKKGQKIPSFQSTYTILCIGDSYTAGSGANPEESYPAQLQKLLNKNTTKTIFKVINAGVGAYNTRMILNELKNKLIQVQPNLVIILAGGANFWNYWGYNDYLHKNKLLSKLQNFLYSVKIFKLCKLLLMNIKDKYTSLTQTSNIYNTFDSKYIEIGNFYFNHGNVNKAIEMWENGIKHNPNNCEFYLAIGRAYLQEEKLLEAEKWLKKALQINPYNWEIYAHWTTLCLLYSTNKEKFNECVQYLNKFKEFNPKVKDIILILKQKSEKEHNISMWIEHDLTEMILLCKKYNSQILLLTYPIETYDYRICNNIIKNVAKKYKIKLLNTASIFKDLAHKGFNIKSYFTIDQHCNEKGYRIIAEQLCKIILKEIINP